jgi:hypothetical protein
MPSLEAQDGTCVEAVLAFGAKLAQAPVLGAGSDFAVETILSGARDVVLLMTVSRGRPLFLHMG